MQKAVKPGEGGGGGGPGMYTSSQPLTFIDSDFVGADNTQATEYNYELTFPGGNTMPTQTQRMSQLDAPIDLSQMNQTGARMSQLDAPIELSQQTTQNNGASDLGNVIRPIGFSFAINSQGLVFFI